MALEQIIQKQPVIDTPRASDLAASCGEYENRFQFHVSTHVAIADLVNKWDAMLRNLERGKSTTGLIYADTGYGKTSTMAALWHYAERNDIVAVPPFIWDSIADMLVATHGWVCYGLKSKRPDLIPKLEDKYKFLIGSGIEEIAIRRSQDQGISLESARRFVQALKDEGRIVDSVSANGLIDYLRVAASILLQAEYKGLLILPDEFELFLTNPDIAKNFSELKDLIFPLFQEDNLPIGCVVSTYRKTFSEIQLRESYMLARFNKPEGNVIDLERVYGKAENNSSFAHELWDKLSVVCELSSEEREAISEDVLDALGQFLGHQRTTAIISGPRSVVATFRRAAIHYNQKKQPYSIFDFCEDYLNQRICFNQQETDTVKVYTSIIGQPIVNNEPRQKVVKLLCAFPDGVPPQMFQKHGIANADRHDVVQGLLGTHVITKIIGPTLVHYKDSLEASDQLIEILKVLRNQYNPGSSETHRAAVRALVNYIVPEIFKQAIAASPTGWSGMQKMESDIEPIFQMQLQGTSVRDYPKRTLTVHVGTEKYQDISGPYRYSQLFTSFALDTQGIGANSCEVKENGLYFRFNIQQPINPEEVPRDISKLGDLFLPEAITPSLLLSMLDFFEKEMTISQIKQTKQEAQVNLLKSHILNELTRYFFSESVKDSAVSDEPELSQVSIGKNFVERTLTVLIRKLFPSYRAVAISNQWINVLTNYTQYLKDAQSLGVKRGFEPIKMINADVPGMFNVRAHTTFENTYYPNGIWRDLLQVDEIDENGETIEERIEVKNTQKRVAVYFKLHDLESRILNQLEESPILVDGKEAKALKLPEIFKQEKERGYLDEEIEQLLKFLEARGLVAQREQQGIGYLYLVDTEINLVELLRKLQSIEELEQLAKSSGFTPEWDQDESPSTLREILHKEGIDSNEVLKDSLRQKLRSAENNFKNQCGRLLVTERDRVEKKRQEIATLHLDMPQVLSQTTGHPMTEFSILLFQDIRNEIRSAYNAVPERISARQNEAKDTLNKSLQSYMNERTPEKAIEVAVELRELTSIIGAKIDTLKTMRSEAEGLYELFEKWRNLARRVEQDWLIMSEAKESDAVKNLLDRLDEEQRLIKQHLADRTLSLKQVLESHEHFTNRISAIKGEFDQIAANRKDEFINFQAGIEEQLRSIIDKPDISEPYNPTDEEGCYHRVREKAVDKIEGLVEEQAINRIRDIQVELVKPLEVFKVSDAVKNEAETLKEKVSELEQKINIIRNDLKPGGIEENLPTVIKLLLSIREEGTEVLEKMGQVQKHLKCDKDELSSRAQKLLDLIGDNSDKDFTELIIELRQSGDEMFHDASQIIESLEELYQRNWLNIKVSPTTIQ